MGRNRRGRRQSRRWLHAGIVADAKKIIRDVFYSFERRHWNGRWCLCITWAADKRGTPLSNHGIGLNKADMITWDRHHHVQWIELETNHGTWRRGKGLTGRAFRRQTLLATWLNRGFRDPFPNGKAADLVLAAPVNVNHFVEDFSGRTIGEARSPLESEGRKYRPEECYPATDIPLSTVGINFGAWRYERIPAVNIVVGFLNGGMRANPDAGASCREKLDVVESAFYECGWRVNRTSMEVASEEMLRGALTAFFSRAWVADPPFMFDQKGRNLGNIMRRIQEAHGDDDIDDRPDSDNDGQSDDDNQPGGGSGNRLLSPSPEPGPSGTVHPFSDTIAPISDNTTNTVDITEQEDEALEEDSLFVPEDGLSDRTLNSRMSSFLSRSGPSFRSRPALPSTIPDSEAESSSTRREKRKTPEDDETTEFNYLSDDSPLKGKGRVMAIKKPKIIAPRERTPGPSLDESDDEGMMFEFDRPSTVTENNSDLTSFASAVQPSFVLPSWETNSIDLINDEDDDVKFAIANFEDIIIIDDDEDDFMEIDEARSAPARIKSEASDDEVVFIARRRAPGRARGTSTTVKTEIDDEVEFIEERRALGAVARSARGGDVKEENISSSSSSASSQTLAPRFPIQQDPRSNIFQFTVPETDT